MMPSVTQNASDSPPTARVDTAHLPTNQDAALCLQVGLSYNLAVFPKGLCPSLWPYAGLWGSNGTRA